MIGRLTGLLARKEPPSLLLDVNGVGYELDAPMSTFYDLPATGDRVTLYTHLVVREDAHLLYGFSRESQRQLFRNLLKVNGVGRAWRWPCSPGFPNRSDHLSGARRHRAPHQGAGHRPQDRRAPGDRTARQGGSRRRRRPAPPVR